MVRPAVGTGSSTRASARVGYMRQSWGWRALWAPCTASGQDRQLGLDRETEGAVLEAAHLTGRRSGALGEDHHRHLAVQPHLALVHRGVGARLLAPRQGHVAGEASSQPTIGILNSSFLVSHFISNGMWAMRRMSTNDSWLATTT